MISLHKKLAISEKISESRLQEERWRVRPMAVMGTVMLAECNNPHAPHTEGVSIRKGCFLKTSQAVRPSRKQAAAANCTI